MARASHAVGKTMVAGGLVNWHYDCWDPSLTITTAPSSAQVKDLLWKEIRNQRKGRPGLMPKAPSMESSETHRAVGYTARDATSFQGRHEEKGLIVLDEAVGVEGQFWDACEGIASGGDWSWLNIYNPTDVSSRAYEEELQADCTIIRISALDHPNITAGLRGEPEPYPGAVSLRWVEERIRKWCTPISPSDKKLTDFEFPPGSDRWYRPSIRFESRVLGVWPTASTNGVWNEALWEFCLIPRPIQLDRPLEIGCDVARFGDDYTVIFARRGRSVLWAERHNGWKLSQTTGRCKQLCAEFAEPGEDPKRVICKIDDDGVGGGVTDYADGYNFVPINAGSTATQPEDYPNRRSELWFTTAQLAEEGLVDLSRLSQDQRNLLRSQLLAPTYTLDSSGRRVVESKDTTKKKLSKNKTDLKGGSPDDADALNLAFARPLILQWK